MGIYVEEMQCSKENYRNANLLEETRQSRIDDYNKYLGDEELITRMK